MESFRKRRTTGSSIIVNLDNCKYPMLAECVESKRGWRIKKENDDDNWNLYWTDKSVSPMRLQRLKKFQRINHFPGMATLCRKAQLASHLQRMATLLPNEFNYVPKTFIYPKDAAVISRMKTTTSTTWIVKPDSGAQGKGIFLTKKLEKKLSQLDCSYVIQQYIPHPLLINGYKFDLRLYVLVKSENTSPSIYIFTDGLVRICSVKYKNPKARNLKCKEMHLTNYSLNKTHSNFIESDCEDSGNKRTLKWFLQKYDTTKVIWKELTQKVVSTILSAVPILSSHPKSSQCFELLGFDFMLNQNLESFLIEVNHSPSFNTSTSKLDKSVKTRLIQNTLSLIGLRRKDKKRLERRQKSLSQQRLLNTSSINKVIIEEGGHATDDFGEFEKCFPEKEDSVLSHRHDKILQASHVLYKSSTGLLKKTRESSTSSSSIWKYSTKTA